MPEYQADSIIRPGYEENTVSQGGTPGCAIIVRAILRKRFGIKEGSLVAALEARAGSLRAGIFDSSGRIPEDRSKVFRFCCQPNV